MFLSLSGRDILFEVAHQVTRDGYGTPFEAIEISKVFFETLRAIAVVCVDK